MRKEYRVKLFLLMSILIVSICACSPSTSSDAASLANQIEPENGYVQTTTDTSDPKKDTSLYNISENNSDTQQNNPQQSDTQLNNPQQSDTQQNNPQQSDIQQNTIQHSNAPASPERLDEILKIIIFDVGQADCALIKVGQQAMLIDAGDTGQDNLILDYLAHNEITKLDFLVASHPHSDHIGSMPAIINAMESIGTILMPDVVHTTVTFEHFLDAIEETDTDVIIPQPGEIFEMGSVKIQVLAPNEDSYEDLNNYSIVLRIEYGKTVFLFTGDAEDISEQEQLKQGLELKADFIKIGHHGSNSSSTQEYLTAVSPDYAVISCGKDNTYGHPNADTLTRLFSAKITLFRTDENGSVTILSDGNTLTVSAERMTKIDTPTPTPTPISNAKADITYIGNKNSYIFHQPSCSTLPAEKNRIYFTNREEAINRQFRPCKKCNP